MIVEAEYQVNDVFLDVIWKRTIRSVPTFAFEINLNDSLENSLKPLKHSFDLWNSRPFLVTEESRISEANELLSSHYHEFASNVKILTVAQIEELYKSKRKYFDLEEKYGLR